MEAQTNMGECSQMPLCIWLHFFAFQCVPSFSALISACFSGASCFSSSVRPDKFSGGSSLIGDIPIYLLYACDLFSSFQASLTPFLSQDSEGAFQKTENVVSQRAGGKKSKENAAKQMIRLKNDIFKAVPVSSNRCFNCLQIVKIFLYRLY